MKKRNVPKEERETILVFNEAEDTATIYTFNSGLKNRLANFTEKYPNLCRMTVNDAVYGSVTYEIQKSRVSVRLIAPYSEERRRAASEHAKKMEYVKLRDELGAKVDLEDFSAV